VNRSFWHRVGGCSADHWAWDQSYPQRVVLQTDGFFLEIPMPVLAHFGAASWWYGHAFPEDDLSDQSHNNQMMIMCKEFGIEWREDGKSPGILSDACADQVRSYEQPLKEWISSLYLESKHLPPEGGSF
jgi:hypothetical protein